MKRRLSADEDGDEDSSSSPPTTFPTSHRKRVRYDSLERTLAHMTLGNALAPTPEDVDMWPKTPLPHGPGLRDDVILPSSVEEPDTPTSESVDMDVEPIPVTGDTCAPMASRGQLDIKEVQISSTVLECLKRQTKCPPPLIPFASQTCQALVLYRAPRPACEDQEATPTREDDVMEVE